MALPPSSSTRATAAVSNPHHNLLEATMTKADASSSGKTKEQQQPQNPVVLLRAMFARNSTLSHNYSRSSSSQPLLLQQHQTPKFHRPSQDAMAAYDMETCRAVRTGNLHAIQQLHQQGHSLDGSNQFGESLLHMACRRGDKAVVEFMVKQARVCTDVRDDMGRTVFHDAFWTSKPNLELMDVLVECVSPLLLLATDVRGHTPFDYARKSHWETWCRYLQEREELLQRRLAVMGNIIIVAQ